MQLIIALILIPVQLVLFILWMIICVIKTIIAVPLIGWELYKDTKKTR